MNKHRFLVGAASLSTLLIVGFAAVLLELPVAVYSQPLNDGSTDGDGSVALGTPFTCIVDGKISSPSEQDGFVRAEDENGTIIAENSTTLSINKALQTVSGTIAPETLSALQGHAPLSLLGVYSGLPSDPEATFFTYCNVPSFFSCILTGSVSGPPKQIAAFKLKNPCTGEEPPYCTNGKVVYDKGSGVMYGEIPEEALKNAGLGTTCDTIDVTVWNQKPGSSGGCDLFDASPVASCEFPKAYTSLTKTEQPGPGGGGTSTACEESVKITFNGENLVQEKDPNCYCQFDIDAHTSFEGSAVYRQGIIENKEAFRNDAQKISENLHYQSDVPLSWIKEQLKNPLEAWDASIPLHDPPKSASPFFYIGEVKRNITTNAAGANLASEVTLNRQWQEQPYVGFIHPPHQLVWLKKGSSTNVFRVTVSGSNPKECQERAHFINVGKMHGSIGVEARSRVTLNGNKAKMHFNAAYANGAIPHNEFHSLAHVSSGDTKMNPFRERWLDVKESKLPGDRTGAGKKGGVTVKWLDALKSGLEKLLKGWPSILVKTLGVLAFEVGEEDKDLKDGFHGFEQWGDWKDDGGTEVKIENAFWASTEAASFDWALQFISGLTGKATGQKGAGDQNAKSKAEVRHEMRLEGKLDNQTIFKLLLRKNGLDTIKLAGGKEVPISGPPVSEVNTSIAWKISLSTTAIEDIKKLLEWITGQIVSTPPDWRAPIDSLLENTINALERGDTEAAEGQLNALINLLEARLKNGTIERNFATQAIAILRNIINMLKEPLQP